MIRARACFLACRFGEQPAHRRGHRPSQSDKRSRQLFSEVLVAEDVDLGSRIHALGYKSIFLNEVLARGQVRLPRCVWSVLLMPGAEDSTFVVSIAVRFAACIHVCIGLRDRHVVHAMGTGLNVWGACVQVPLAPRDFWKQRARWSKAAHLYILDPRSVFWRRQPHMSLYQKSIYCVPLILHCCLIFTEPIMFTLPFICVVFNICPYGIDVWLWLTHILRLIFTFFLSTHADTIGRRVSALHAQTSSRVLFFINVKAVLNTLMVGCGYKLPGAFKETKKASAAKPRPVGEGVAGAPLDARALRAPSITLGNALEGAHDSSDAESGCETDCNSIEGEAQRPECQTRQHVAYAGAADIAVHVPVRTGTRCAAAMAEGRERSHSRRAAGLSESSDHAGISTVAQDQMVCLRFTKHDTL